MPLLPPSLHTADPDTYTAGRRAPKPYWAGGSTPVEDRTSRLPYALGIAGGTFAAGFLPRKDGRVWDTYARGIKHAEMLSPGQLLKTFQLSERVSPYLGYESFKIGSDVFNRTYIDKRGITRTSPNMRTRELYSRMLNTTVPQLEAKGVFSEGLQFQKTGKIFGKISTVGGEVLSETAFGLQVGSQRGYTLADWFGRRMGMNLGVDASLLGKGEQPFLAITAPQVTHASNWYTKARLWGEYRRAYWHGQIGRLNRLLQSGLEFASKLPSRHLQNINETIGSRLMVHPGTSATQMLGRYVGRGLAIAGAWKALQYLSYRRGETDSGIESGLAGAAIGAAAGMFAWKTPRAMAVGASIGAITGMANLFDKGIVPGAATAGVRAHIAAAKGAEVFGLQDAKAEQEAFMKESTSVRGLAGTVGTFAFTGAFAGLMARYMLLGRTAEWVKDKGIDTYEAFNERSQFYRQAMKAEVEATSGAGKLGRWLWPKALKSEGVFQETLKRVRFTGGRLGLTLGLAAFAGANIYGALATGNVPFASMLAPEKKAEELEAIYAGKQDVEVKRGRWWEFGRSSWEGGRVSHYRPHAYHMMMANAKDIGLYGSEENKWDMSPILHPIKGLFSDDFKYRWEKDNYYSRPYPSTGTYFEDIPFIGPALTPLGQYIKPQRLMHTEEWLRGEGVGEGGAVKHVPTTADNEPVYELGGIPLGDPASRLDTTQRLGEQIYRLNELRGLTGFTHSGIKEAITGSQDYYDQEEQLETARRAYGAERKYWDMQLGGLMGTTEPFRRFLPHRRRQIDLYNPIRNTMPDWLPGPDYYVDLQHGDPYTQVIEGEVRLPGPGYAALHPELRGVAPEDYPLFHRYKILADVAMYSDQFGRAKAQMESAVGRGEVTSQQIQQLRTINEQLVEQKRRKTFTQRQFEDDTLEEMRIKVKEQISPGMFVAEGGGVFKLSGIQMAHEQLSAINASYLEAPNMRQKRLAVADYLRDYIGQGTEVDVFVHKDPLHTYKTTAGKGYIPATMSVRGEDLGAGLVEQGLAEFAQGPLGIRSQYGTVARSAGRLWESFTHYESPLEYLTPISPRAKMFHHRTAIEEYERTRVWGTEAAFWQHPIEHFIKPTYWLAKRLKEGTDEKPERVIVREQIEEYFDKLKYLKMGMLSEAAAGVGNTAEQNKYANMQKDTLFGVNPYGSLSNIFSALPVLERDYFQEFADAKTDAQRSTIARMLPANETHVYEAQWKRNLGNTLKIQQKMGVAAENAGDTLAALHVDRVAEGRPLSPILLTQYKEEREQGESYADWSRDKELQDYFKQAPLPGADWVGWHPHTDLEDVKLKLVQNLGQDMHDYNLWGSRARTLPRKPYLDDAAMRAVTFSLGTTDPETAIKQIEATLRDRMGMKNVRVRVSSGGSNGDQVNAKILDERVGAVYAYKNDSSFFGMI